MAGPAGCPQDAAYWCQPSGLPASGAIAQWDDDSGNARHLTQTNSALQPVVVSNAVNGNRAADFPGGIIRWLRNTGTVLAPPHTYFVVLRSNAIYATSDNHYVVSSAVQTSRSDTFLDNRWRLVAGSVLIGDVPPVLEWVVRGSVFNGSSSEVRRNGVVTATGNTGTQSMSGITIGNYAAPSTGFAWDGLVAELLSYPRLLTSSEHSQVQAYFDSKYFVSILSVTDVSHTTSSDTPTLGQAHALVIDAATHAQTATAVTLAQVHQLEVQGTTHAHTADVLDLVSAHALLIDSSWHAVDSDHVTLPLEVTLLRIRIDGREPSTRASGREPSTRISGRIGATQ